MECLCVSSTSGEDEYRSSKSLVNRKIEFAISHFSFNYTFYNIRTEVTNAALQLEYFLGFIFGHYFFASCWITFSRRQIWVQSGQSSTHRPGSLISTDLLRNDGLISAYVSLKSSNWRVFFLSSAWGNQTSVFQKNKLKCGLIWLHKTVSLSILVLLTCARAQITTYSLWEHDSLPCSAA